MPTRTLAALLPIDGDDVAVQTIAATLRRFGSGAVRCARAGEIAIVALAPHERYAARSASLRRLGVDVDTWPVPPAGLFVVEEKTIYLRSATPMTIAHEFGHALDCALGGGVYRSGFDPELRAAFASARAFVTPYAATALDEYVAESLRAYVEVNDARSPWPKATRARLAEVDPRVFAWCERLFASEFAAAP